MRLRREISLTPQAFVRGRPPDVPGMSPRAVTPSSEAEASSALRLPPGVGSDGRAGRTPVSREATCQSPQLRERHVLQLDTADHGGPTTTDTIEVRTPPRVAALLCELPIGPGSAAEARRWLRERFHDSVPVPVLDDAELILSELVANAVAASSRHPIRVSVRQLVTGLLVEVADDCNLPPRPRTPDSWEEQGRGLLLVARLCGGNWGWQPLGRGKSVWSLIFLGPYPEPVPFG